MRTDNPVRKIDRFLLITYLIMVTIGYFNIYSSAYNPEHPSHFDFSMEYGKQIIWIGVSLLLGGLILLLEGNFIKKYSSEF